MCLLGPSHTRAQENDHHPLSLLLSPEQTEDLESGLTIGQEALEK